MKAIVKTAEGAGELAWSEWPEPVAKPGHVVVEIERAGICSTDVAIYNWTYRGRRPLQLPSTLGHEAFGTVSALGDGVHGLALGERVGLQVIWGRPYSRQSSLGFENLDPDWVHIGASELGGAFAERIAIPAERVVPIPASVAAEDAVLLEPLAVATHAVELVDLRPAETAVVVGPGAFGLLMCLIARASGAARVIVVGLEGVDDSRLEVARRVGAEATLTFSGAVEPTLDSIHQLTGGEGGDVVLDCGGTSESTFLSLELAAQGGRVAVFGFTREAKIEPLRQIIRKGLTLRGVSAAQRRHYGSALRLIETGMVRPSQIVTHRLPMREAAHGMELLNAREAAKVLLEVA